MTLGYVRRDCRPAGVVTEANIGSCGWSAIGFLLERGGIEWPRHPQALSIQDRRGLLAEPMHPHPILINHKALPGGIFRAHDAPLCEWIRVRSRREKDEV